MRWFFYNLFFAIAYFALLPHFLLRMKKRGGYRAHFAERFGKYTPDIARRLAEKPRVWIHAVSVGEANLAGQIIRELRSRNPGFSCILSTTSSTGRAVCEKIAGPDDVLVYLPVDFPVCVRRMLSIANISAMVITETELWPNLLRSAHARKIPLLLANGRVSDHSAPGYRRLRFFFGPVLHCFDTILVQSELDRSRLLAAGGPDDRIHVSGSVKFDITPPSAAKTAAAIETLSIAGITPGTECILLGGSTWPGEELALANAWRSLSQKFPNARLVLVPRHFERGNELAAELSNHGFSVIRRSKPNAPIAPVGTPSSPILLVDTTGELFALYSQADIVFVGKTLDPNAGGQNMIEPASFAKPVLCGPHTENFLPVMEIFRKAGAVREIASADELLPALTDLLEHPEKRIALGQRAGQTVAASRGALARTADAIEALVQP